MFIYLLHLDEPLSPDHTSQHYTGKTIDLYSVLEAHRRGNKQRCNFTHVAKQRDIGLSLVRAWYGGAAEERAFKNLKNAPRYCPICNSEPAYWNGAVEVDPDELEFMLEVAF
jgi:hypothetical protein